MIAHADHEIRIQTHSRMARAYEVVGPRNHLHHSTRTCRADREAVRVRLVQREQRIDLVVERQTVLSPEAFVIDVFDNTQTLRNVHELRSVCVLSNTSITNASGL